MLAEIRVYRIISFVGKGEPLHTCEYVGVPLLERPILPTHWTLASQAISTLQE